VFICSSTSNVFGYSVASTGTPCSYAESSSPKDSSTATSTMSAPNKPISIPWLIVGGGIHGVHISARLIGSGVCSTPSQDMCIVDGHDSLLKSWKSRTRNTGMKYLRSSAGYHLDVLEDSLRFFGNGDNHGDEFATRTDNDESGKKKAKKNKRKKKKRSQIHNNNKEGYFSNDYKRPRLDIFNQHCDSVIDKYNLDQIHIQGIVTKIEPLEDYVKVQVLLNTDSKDEGEHNHAKTIEYHAEKIVLALGNDEPSYADWVEDYDVEKGFVRHLLDVDAGIDADVNHRPDKEKLHSVAIVGGGITAAHKALELSRRYQQEKKDGNAALPSIHLISRHPLKEQLFDTHQDWMMDRAASKRSEESGGYGTPKRQVLFQQCDCWKERRLIIAQERIPGTVTPAVHRGEDGLNYAIKNGDIEWHQAEIVDKAYKYAMEDGEDEISHLELTLSSGQMIQVDQVLLATGFKKNVPGGSLVRDLVDNSRLDVSKFCGYPIVDENLLWDKKRIYVAGALAELELGPSARNIAGARLAAERIVQAFI
jgi:lysine/ornithine N-monooxygenase